MVVDPEDFDMKKQQVFYSEFGFIICSQSEFFRSKMEELCLNCHKLRQRGMSSKFSTDIRKRMKKYVANTLKTERDRLELVALYFDLTYFTATSHQKDTHLRKFISLWGTTPQYFLYCGSKYVSSIEYFI